MAQKSVYPSQSSAQSSPQQLVKATDIRPGKSLHLKPTSEQPNNTNFCTFVESMPRQHLVCFFRQIIHEIEEIRDIHDFHLKVKNTKPAGFVIEVLYGDHKEGPEKLVDDTHCISCKDEAPLFPGVSGGGVCAGECVLREFSDQPYVQCSLDAKARPGFIVTPLRHVERLGELDENELYFLWSVGVRALRNEGFGGFVSMIVNHGSYRNLPHLHLKIWVDDGMHKRARVRWTESRRQLWARLELLTSRLPKRRALCVPFEKQGKCRYGERCRYLHESA